MGYTQDIARLETGRHSYTLLHWEYGIHTRYCQVGNRQTQLHTITLGIWDTHKILPGWQQADTVTHYYTGNMGYTQDIARLETGRHSYTLLHWEYGIHTRYCQVGNRQTQLHTITLGIWDTHTILPSWKQA